MTTQGGLKYAWLAGLLNIFPYPFGFGYFYLGHVGRFTLAILAGSVAGAIGLVGGWFSGYDSILGMVATAWAAAAGLVGMFTALDGWRLAVEHNATLGTQHQDTKGTE